MFLISISPKILPVHEVVRVLISEKLPALKVILNITNVHLEVFFLR